MINTNITISPNPVCLGIIKSGLVTNYLGSSDVVNVPKN